MDIPLRPLYGGFLHEISLFLATLAGRLVDYTVIIRQAVGISTQNASFSMQRSKKALLRLLMRRQGAFNSHPRVTMATVSVGVFLALVPLNVDIQADQGLFDLGQQVAGVAVEPSALIASARVGVGGEENLPSINEVVTHVIQPGDTLSALSSQYLVPSDAIAYVNNISVNTLLRPGDTLTIPPIQGLTHKVAAGETVASIAEKYNVSPQAVVDANVLKPPFNIFGGDVLVIPGGEVPKPAPVQPVLAANQVVPPVSGGLSLQTVAGSGGYIMPTGGKITQYASYYHMALDIARGCGDEIWAAQSGTVVYSGWRAGGYGFMVELNHPDGRVSQYAHMSRTAVSVGNVVTQGDVIGYTGATGIAYGCHLHFVVQSGGRAINPLDVL